MTEQTPPSAESTVPPAERAAGPAETAAVDAAESAPGSATAPTQVLATAAAAPPASAPTPAPAPTPVPAVSAQAPGEYQEPVAGQAPDQALYQAPYQAPLQAPVPGQVPPQGPHPYQDPNAPQAGYRQPGQPAHQAGVPAFGLSQADMAQYSSALLQPPRDPEAEARRRQRQRNTVRWVSAVVLAVAVAAGSALAVTQPERTDLPGLATAADGRYVFPALSLPTLPPGEAVPGNTTANPGGRHLTDIRKLLLPAPQGATPDKALPGASGWVSQTAMAAMGDPSIAGQFAEYGLRHTAGVGWKTPDGATTAIYLMQYADSQAAGTAGPMFDSGLTGTSSLPAGAQQLFLTSGTDTSVTYYTATSGGATTRYGEFTSGDTCVLVVFSAPKSVPMAPFEQELQLQSELLK